MRASAAPDSIYNDLLQELASLYLGESSANEFTLRQLKVKADQLAGVNAVWAMEVRGHLALLSDKLEAGRELLNRVLALSPNSPNVILRYMQGLQQRGLSAEVAEVFFEHRHAFAGNVTATKEARQILASHGYLKAAGELRAELAKMNATVEEVSYAPGEHLLAQFDSDGVTDSDTAPVVAFVRRFLFEEGVNLQRVAITVVPAEDKMPSAVLYELEVSAAPDRASELEWDLYGRLDAEGFPLELDRRIVFSVTTDSKGA